MDLWRKSMLLVMLVLVSVSVMAVPFESLRANDIVPGKPFFKINRVHVNGYGTEGSKVFSTLQATQFTDSLSADKKVVYRDVAGRKVIVYAEVMNLGSTGSMRVEATMQKKELIDNWFGVSPFAVVSRSDNCNPHGVEESNTQTKMVKLEKGESVVVRFDLDPVYVLGSNKAKLPNDEYGVLVEAYEKCAYEGNSFVQGYYGVPLYIPESEPLGRAINLFVGHSGVDPSSTDGIQNQGETDIDCGGENAPGCNEGQRCLLDSDCGVYLDKVGKGCVVAFGSQKKCAYIQKVPSSYDGGSSGIVSPRKSDADVCVPDPDGTTYSPAEINGKLVCKADDTLEVNDPKPKCSSLNSLEVKDACEKQEANQKGSAKGSAPFGDVLKNKYLIPGVLLIAGLVAIYFGREKR